MSLIASCHCGATRIELPAQPTEAKSCNCSYCARTGAVWAYYRPEELAFLSREAEATYAVDPKLNAHHFCSRCGTQTWGDSPDWSALYHDDGSPKYGDATAIPTERIFAVNLNLVDDLDWASITVQAMDGKNNW